MRADIFFGFSQVAVEGVIPSEDQMFASMLSQVRLADTLGFQTAWFGGTHLSLAPQQQGPSPILPHFQGEMCLNTDIFQLAHLIFSHTQRIHVGSAIQNLFANGGPVAQAEAARTFLTLNRHRAGQERRLYLGLGTGRFDRVNEVFGVYPRTPVERVAWAPLRGLILAEALEIFLRLIQCETLSSDDITPKVLRRAHFRSDEQWAEALVAAGSEGSDSLSIPPFWTFDRLRLIPKEAPLDALRVVLGTHDPWVQRHANRFFPCQVFNLSVTPKEVIDDTHARMAEVYHPDGGAWQRAFMPRTVMVFVDAGPGGATARRSRALERAERALKIYWQAMEGTIDEDKVARGVRNAVHGDPEQVAAQLRARFHPEDSMMFWFDFADHESARVEDNMTAFWRDVLPKLEGMHVEA